MATCLCVLITRVLGVCAASLGEFRIRDLNDEINKVLREKGHWERRIIELGGPNYFVRIPAGRNCPSLAIASDPLSSGQQTAPSR